MDSSLTILSGAVSDRGLSDKRPQNEDSYLEMARCGIFAVADGVGGAQAGEVASQMAMEILGEAFANFNSGSDAEDVMRTAVERANGAIHQMSQELPQLSNMATTVVALHLAENIATIGHVGDSRLYRVDREGNLHRETADHSMVAEEVRAGRMTEEQAENHPSRNIISRALGAEATVDIDLKTMMIEPGTAFLICSDGITRHVSDQEIKGVLTFGGEPAEICEYLKGLCYERGAEDNLTAVVVKVQADAAFALDDTIAEDDPDEEPTLASARSFDKTIPYDQTMSEDEDEDSILELGTADPRATQPVGAQYGKPDFGDETLSLSDKETIETLDDRSPAAEEEVLSVGDETIPLIDSNAVTDPAVSDEIILPSETGEQMPAGRAETFSMFGDAVTGETLERGSSSVERVATALGILVLGAAIGLGIYHFLIGPRMQQQTVPELTTMKTDNIPFTSFERGRRDVDEDAAAYLKNRADPEVAEDFYLRGRAKLLLGDANQAKFDLSEAQSRLMKADPANQRILTADIAALLVIASDPLLVTKFNEQMKGISKPQGNVNSVLPASNPRTANQR
jgi:serine/threonine protein phosphatase PrpC